MVRVAHPDDSRFRFSTSKATQVFRVRSIIHYKFQLCIISVRHSIDSFLILFLAASVAQLDGAREGVPSGGDGLVVVPVRPLDATLTPLGSRTLRDHCRNSAPRGRGRHGECALTHSRRARRPRDRFVRNSTHCI